MDIVRAFTDRSVGREIPINIIGTADDPLFQASQVGKLLGLTNVHESIKDFDDDEKYTAKSADAIGRLQTTMFLTELGLYRLVGASRKPCARHFQKWVAQVVKEIRMTGKYELEQRIDIAVKALEAKEKETEQLVVQQADTHSRELAIQQQAHEIAAKKTRHDALMTANEGTPLVYLVELSEFRDLPDGRFLVKFGETDDIVSRLPYLRKEYGEIYLVELYVCTQPHKFEQWLKQNAMFLRLKYDGCIKGRQHKELLAVTPAEYLKLTRFIKKHLGGFQGWTAEQTLEKMRLRNEDKRMQMDMENKRLEALAAIFKSVSRTTDPATRNAMVDAMHSLIHTTPVQSQHISTKSEDFESVDDDDDDEEEEEGNRIGSSGSDGDVTSSPTSVISVLGTQPTIKPIEPTDSAAELTIVAATHPIIEPASNAREAEVHLFPPQPKKKMGRPAKAKVPPPTDANTPLQRFIDECFDTSNPDAKTHVALVRARHRLWRATHVSREETKTMVDFFKDRFNVVFEMDPTHNMKSSFYAGLAMRPWVPPSAPESTAQADIDAFVREACEVHVMGRARMNDLWDAFVAWKRERESSYADTDVDRSRFISYMKNTFVYHTGVPITKDAVGAPGIYGLYIATATAETREVGWNRSPNTHGTVLKLDARGNVVDVIDSQDVFAHTVAKKSSQHICTEFTRCFNSGMRGLILADGYQYMRSKDHATMLMIRSRAQTDGGEEQPSTSSTSASAASPGPLNFARFLEECCETDPDSKACWLELGSRCRLFFRSTQPFKEQLAAFLKDRGHKETHIYDESTRTNFAAYTGLKMKPLPPFQITESSSEIERFVYDTCTPNATGRITCKDLESAYETWKQDKLTKETKKLMNDFFNTNFLGSIVHDGTRTRFGFYGVSLKGQEHVGLKMKNKNRHVVEQLDAETMTLVKTYDSITHAAAEMGASVALISKAISGAKRCNGFIFQKKAGHK